MPKRTAANINERNLEGAAVSLLLAQLSIFGLPISLDCQSDRNAVAKRRVRAKELKEKKKDREAPRE